MKVIQRLIKSNSIDWKSAKYVVEQIWMLMESNIQEVSDDDVVNISDYNVIADIV